MKKNNIHYAGFWIRLVAVMIDSIILLIPSLIISNLLLLRGIVNIHFIDLSKDLFYLLMLLWIYYSLQLSYGWQATLGMKLLKIKIVNGQGESISLGQATVRFFGAIFSGVLALIGFLMAAFDKKKQGLHDKIANTFVVYNKK